MNPDNSLEAESPLVYVLRSRDRALADQASRLIQLSSPFLDYTISTFPSGTDHSGRHTRTVERIGRMLLTDEFLAELSSHELFFLSLACHYHDLAMAGTEADDETGEERDQVRRDHAIRIGEIIRTKWAELGFADQRSAQVLGEVCRGHRPKKSLDGEANWDELNETEVLGPGTAVRVRLLSALIYAIDELHLGADRAPERVQSWRKIQDEESRRHWRRHQAVSGPALRLPCSLLFQASADTPTFEENLRSQMFRKALFALRDLRRQAKAEGIMAELPSVTIQWQRQVMWEVLLPVVCSNMNPLSRNDIVHAIHARFQRDTTRRVQLDDVCAEAGNSPEELHSSIGRAVDDAVTRKYLVLDPSHSAAYTLSVRSMHSDKWFKRMREADDLDQLFEGKYRQSWEQHLFASAFGRRYIHDSVFPVVEQTFGVRLTYRPKSDPVRVLLECCPTAARLVRDNAPLPNNLVKDDLLSQAALTGSLIDLYSDPERLLDQPVRDAIRMLMENNASIASTVRLLEELALLGGFTHEQVSAAVFPSKEAQKAIEDRSPKSDQSLQLTLTQTVPNGAAGTVHLHRLLLAGQRAGTPIQLTAVGDHGLDVRVEGEAEWANRDTKGVIVGIGPASGHRPAAVRLPAHVEVSRASRTIRLYLGRFSADSPTAYPVIVTLPAPSGSGRFQMKFESEVYWPDLTIRDWRTLEVANQMIRTPGVRIELIIEEGRRLLGVMDSPSGQSMFNIGPELIQRALRGLEGDQPAPVRMSESAMAEIAKMTANDRTARWSYERDHGRTSNRRASSVFLRLTTPEGHPFDERFLGFFPFNLFPAPDLDAETATALDLKQKWAEAEIDIRLTSFFEADIHVLAQKLCEWCDDPRSEFPIRFGSEATPSPVTRSVLTVRLLQSRDRVWHRDRPTIFELRPVNRKEAYTMEAKYWREVGDDRRAQLAEEICERESGIA